MRRGKTVPDGFVVEARDGVELLADARWLEPLLRAGLDRPEGWQQRLRGAGPVPVAGRGSTVRLELAPGRVARLKQLRRGGLLAPLWRDRFAGRRRALANLRAPLEARRRGVATPAPLALLVESVLPGLVRAWLAVEEIDGTVDLATRLATGHPPAGGELAAALGLVRAMHDRGVEHRDLNLGNLLLAPGTEPEAWVIDLDGARLHTAPLGLGRRRRALRRLERSYVKVCHPRPAAPEIRRAIYEAYAAGDEALLPRLRQGSRAAAVWIRLHRLGWRGK